MQTYSQLIRSGSNVRKQLWYICGPETALVYDALELAKDHVYSGVSSVCTGTFFASSMTFSELENFVDMPFFEERKLVIVHEADKIDCWPRISELMKELDASIFIVFVGEEIPDSDSEILKNFTNNKIARSIRCIPLSEEAQKDWIQDRLNITTTAYAGLISRSNGNYEWLVNKIRILEAMEVQTVTPEVIEAVCHDTGLKTFEDSLIEFDKKQCLRYIKERGASSINIRRVVDDVFNLAILQIAMGEHAQQLRPLADTTGLTRQQLTEYMPNAASYDPTTVRRIFRSLTMLNTNLSRGDRVAYLSLIGGW